MGASPFRGGTRGLPQDYKKKTRVWASRTMLIVIIALLALLYLFYTIYYGLTA